MHLKALLELGVPHARDERSLGHVLGRVRCPRELAAGAEGARHNRWYRPDVDEEDDVLDLWEHVVCLGVSGVFTTYVTHTHTRYATKNWTHTGCTDSTRASTFHMESDITQKVRT